MSDTNDELDRWAAEMMGWEREEINVDGLIPAWLTGEVRHGRPVAIPYANWMPSTDHNDLFAVIRKAAEMGYVIQITIHSADEVNVSAERRDGFGFEYGPLTDEPRLVLTALRQAMTEGGR